MPTRHDLTRHDLTRHDLTRRDLLRLSLLAGTVAAFAPACGGSSDLRPSPTLAPGQRFAFPRHFVWGSATSAYQIEGATGEDGRGPSIWDTFCAEAGHIVDGSSGEPAADHYHRWAEDLDLMAGLGLGGYRFSVAWPRVQPDGGGPVNQAGLDFYRRLVDGLLERGIRPAVTLYHWDLPQPIQDAGGWPERDTALRFADYATIVFGALADAGADFLTINEPKTTAMVGHLMGAHAPGLRDPAAAVAAVHHQLLGHGLAVRAFRASSARGRIGIALNLLPVVAVDEAAAQAAAYADAVENRLYLDPVLLGRYPTDALGRDPGQLDADPMLLETLTADGDLAIISSPMDVLGLQYYGSTGIDASGGTTVLHETSLAPWQQIDPESFTAVLRRLADDYPAIPILVTENGIPDDDADGTTRDERRVAFLRDHLVAEQRAIAAGVPVEGHYVWSLLDNFEWAYGYTQRWGVVRVDFDTQERSPKDSARWYADVVAANAVTT